jgi:4a-hydroxytetrahydrobiopterin dehydratase
MGGRERLGDDAVRAAVDALPGWTVTDGKLHREYRFRDFVEAWGFMSQAALHAQAMDHHPEWANVWATVRVDLVTHDAGGITALDVELAGRMEAIATRPRPAG